MRMQFSPEDDGAFVARRDELGEQFAQWLTAQRVAGDASDAGLVMDWRFGYSDGVLDVWTVDEVREFLFEWCPRKLSATPQDCKDIPASVAAFVEFLAHTGLLARGSDLPSQVRRYCERSVAGFVREMGNPANFGMAKGLLGGAFGAGDASEVFAEHLAGLDPEDVGELLAGLIGPDGEPASIGPVRLPHDDDRRSAVRAAPALAQLRALAEHCAAPGRSLTGAGNLRLADARHLVEALGTGDDVEQRSAADMPVLMRLVELALEAGVVRRRRGRLVAVAPFAALDELEAHAKVVRAAVAAGLGGPHRRLAPGVDVVWRAVDDTALAQLGVLLTAGADGVEAEELADLAVMSVEAGFPGLGDLVLDAIPDVVDRQLTQLAGLGVVTVADSPERCLDCGDPHLLATITAAGIAVAVDLIEDAGVPVQRRPEPADADAAGIADLLGTIDETAWVRDATAWFAAQPEPAPATVALVDEITAEHREPIVVMSGLTLVEEPGGEHVVPAVHAQLDGPHGGLVLHWLVGRGEIDAADIEPFRFLSGLVDVLAVPLDAVGPAELVAYFNEPDQAQQLELLESIWRLDHPRLLDVLGALGTHHPVKVVAKAARRAVMKHRSRQR